MTPAEKQLHRAIFATSKTWAGEKNAQGIADAFVEYDRRRSSEAQWIACSERVPEPEETVMWCRVPVVEPYTIASALDAGFDETTFTHWRPMPPPPSEVR